MFYSHQLLARKAPLGQIWRAATLHAKINRKNLNNLNIINICEEILNPSVPMALRLSGILMGGVVIVYERKVKLLYEDVTRLLVELNEAWKVKVKRDPTVLPKGKTQAKYEAVTLQDEHMSDLNELEETLLFSNSDTLMGIHKSAYTEMNLDNIDDSYISHNKGGADLPHDHHQADIDNITIPDRFDSYHADPSLFNQFERFDMEGDDIGMAGEKFPSHTHTDPPPDNFVPFPPLQDVPSPPLQDVPQNLDEIPEKHPGDQVNPQSDEDKVLRTPTMQRPPRRRGRRGPATLMDYEQTMIPGQMYQSWLQDTSDISSERGKKRKHMGGSTRSSKIARLKYLGSIRSIKIARLMDLPPVSLVCGLVTNGTPDIYYPLPLLQQWMKTTEAFLDSPSGGTSPPPPPAPSSSTSPPAPVPAPPVTNHNDDPTTVPFEDHHSGAASGSSVPSIHKFRAERSAEILRRELEADLMNNGIYVTEANGRTGPEADLIVTPGNSGDGVKKAASSGSEHGFVSHGSDLNSGRPNKNRLFSSSRRSGSSLPTVAEDFPWDHPDPNYKLNEVFENDLPENDLMVETGPTQTQKFPSSDQPLEYLTDSIRMQLKSYFDTPGAAQTESLNQLAMGLDRKRAACLFYHTCVLATRGFIKVEQKKAYGNILISRGTKM